MKSPHTPVTSILAQAMQLRKQKALGQLASS
jgi:hypothetical protein